MTKLKINELGAFQGDVVVLKLDRLPEEAEPTDRRVVAEGEATGHDHRVVGDCDLYETVEGLVFVVAPETKVDLVHTADHDPIAFGPGVWLCPTESQVEYDGENERRILD